MKELGIYALITLGFGFWTVGCILIGCRVAYRAGKKLDPISPLLSPAPHSRVKPYEEKKLAESGRFIT